MFWRRAQEKRRSIDDCMRGRGSVVHANASTFFRRDSWLLVSQEVLSVLNPRVRMIMVPFLNQDCAEQDNGLMKEGGARKKKKKEKKKRTY